MIASKTSFSRPIARMTALIAWGFMFSLAFVQIPAARAAGATAVRPLDDKAPSLPLTYSFEKVAEGENGPYVLKLKNTSDATITVSAQILPSVTFHANSKVRNLPEHAIDPGQVWTITELGAADKVTISAKGYAPLELTVP
jgi:hypothetical protein